MQTNEPARIQPARRRLVEVLLRGGVFASVVSAIYPVLRYLTAYLLPTLAVMDAPKV